MRLGKKHLSEEILLDLIDGILPPADSAHAEEHLADCPECSSQAAKFSELVGLMRSDRAVDAPADSVVWAKNLFRSRVTESKPGIIRRIMAVLEMDLSPKNAVFGERSASTPVRQVLFRAEEVGISLRISGDEGEVTVMGQILGEGFDGCRIELQGSPTSLMVSANEMSEFKITKIPAGTYDLFIRTETAEIVIEAVSLE